MPIQYDIHPQRRLVVCEAYGNLTGEDLFELHRRLNADPLLRPDFDQLFDVTTIEDDNVTADDVRRLASRPPYFAPPSRHAVVGRGPMHFGMMRMFELYRDGSAGEFRFFEDRAEAERWLDEERPRN